MTRYQWPSKLSLAGNKRIIEIERNTNFPAGAEDERVNGTGLVGDNLQVKTKDDVDEVGEGLYVNFNELVVSGRKEKKTLRESRAICADECQSTMGQMREGIETKIKSSRQRFYKTPHFRNRWPEQNRCGESRIRRGASILSDTSHLRYLGSPVTDSSISLAPLAPLEPKILPYSFPCQHAILASPIHLKHTHTAGRRRKVGFGR